MQSDYNLPTMEYMLDRIDVRNPEECWPWKNHVDRDGYGRCRGRSASRVMFEVVNGPIGDSHLVVMHLCDNPVCCNPSHLKLGSHGDNIRDSIQKGRRGRSQNLPVDRSLGRDDASSAKYLLALGVKPSHVASLFGVGRDVIRSISTGKTYQDVPWPTGYDHGG